MKKIDCMKIELESLKKRDKLLSDRINLILERIRKNLSKKLGLDNVQKEVNDKKLELEEYKQKIYDNSIFNSRLLLEIYALFLSNIYEEDYRFYQTKIPGAPNYCCEDTFHFITTSNTYEDIMYNIKPLDKIKQIPNFILVADFGYRSTPLYNKKVEKLFCNNMFFDTKGFDLKRVLLENFTYYIIDRRIEDDKPELNIEDMTSYLDGYKETEEYKDTKNMLLSIKEKEIKQLTR